MVLGLDKKSHFRRVQMYTSMLKLKLKAVHDNHVVVKRARAIKPRGSGSDVNNDMADVKLQFDENNENCPCNMAKAQRKKRYLAMASQDSQGNYVLNLILPWRKEKQFKKALRMVRKLDCKTLGSQIRERARRERRRKLKAKNRVAVAATTAERNWAKPEAGKPQSA
ncbi:unnamed protein product [Soboliphyme baturini]|uniref:40S ribosomal protein S6 n=1 Tax=Soboliphyme baturini TaxID=241478 RepID=A0A183IX33_9BILA|nr:unnamed protein product [Soboliphyme baturini]